MKIFGFDVSVSKRAPSGTQSAKRGGGWWSIISEPYAGAWQQNQELKLGDVFRAPTLFRCISLISSDIAKMRIRLMEVDKNGIWKERDSPSYSPVLRRPNAYQNRIQFFANWTESKLKTGNTVVLKERDRGGKVKALHVLDWQFVTPLITQSGEVYYQLTRDDLAGVSESGVTVPASEIVHDRWNTFFHPLVGLSPIYACGVAAAQNITIQNNSSLFFKNGSRPGGVLTAPGAISQETAERLKSHWDNNYTGENAGKVAVLGDGLKYEAMSVKAVDAQLVEQLRWTDEKICAVFGVPPYKAGVGQAPSYDNVSALDAQYYTQCLQIHIESIELALDEGLGLSHPLGTEFDLSDLMRLDVKNQMEVLKQSDGIMTPDEQRKALNLSPVIGGNTVYKQQQDYSLEALAKRDAQENPFATGGTNTTPPTDDTDPEPDEETKQAHLALFQKHLSEALHVQH